MNFRTFFVSGCEGAAAAGDAADVLPERVAQPLVRDDAARQTLQIGNKK